MVRAAFIALLVAAAVVVILLTSSSSSTDAKNTYRVILDNSFGLNKGADLRADGVKVGSVSDLDVQPVTARAIVTVKVTRPDFAGFRKDVFCEVKPQSLIGEYFLNCTPGTSSQPAPKTIPVTQTAGTVPPDLVLDVLRRPARERFGLILGELGIGLSARGSDVQATIRRAVPALRETDKVLNLLADNSRTLNALTRESDTVLASLAANKNNVRRFVSAARNTTAASADRRVALAATIHKLPAFLRELRPTLRDLGTTARVQTPALVDLHAAAPDLTTLFTRLGPFASAARPAVRSLGDASVTGVAAAKAAKPTIHQLNLLGTKSTEPVTNLRFLLEDLDNRDRAAEPNKLSPGGQGWTGLEALLQYFFTQSQAANIYDSKGYILKLNLLINQCSQYTNAQTAIANPARTAACKSWLGPNQPGVTTQVAASDTPAARGTQPAGGGNSGNAGTQAPATSSPAPQSSSPPAATQKPSVPGLLHKVLPILPQKLPAVPPIKLGKLIGHSASTRAARAHAARLRAAKQRAAQRSQADLLDYLLGP